MGVLVEEEEELAPRLSWLFLLFAIAQKESEEELKEDVGVLGEEEEELAPRLSWRPDFAPAAVVQNK